MFWGGAYGEDRAGFVDHLEVISLTRYMIAQLDGNLTPSFEESFKLTNFNYCQPGGNFSLRSCLSLTYSRKSGGSDVASTA